MRQYLKNARLAACFTSLVGGSACTPSGAGPTPDGSSAAGASPSGDCVANPAGYHPAIVAQDFSTTIDNKYLSYTPGSTFAYVQTEGNTVEQDVTADNQLILGVQTVVVHDSMKSPSGTLLEDTYDYYAQDSAGNVWYFGEDTKAYSGAAVSTQGSWIAGVDCAEPGIVMPANPQVGDNYRQEYLTGEAEDQASVVSLSETVTVPYGAFANCLETKEFTRLAPGDVENKYYCPHFGLVRSHDIGTIDAGKKEDLVSVNGAASACANDPGGYDPIIAPQDFSTTIDNPYLFFVPGTVFGYLQSEGNIVEQDVLFDVRTILGVPTLVVHDFLTSPEGELLEDTYDYFAQDSMGNVWYFGEDTQAFSGASISNEGSWLAGVSCAKPGIVMRADPQIGKRYRQEYQPGEAEDEAEVVSLDETVTVPYGTFSQCVETKEFTALAPGDVENKYYCRGVGLVRSHDVGSIDAGKTEDLVSLNGKVTP